MRLSDIFFCLGSTERAELRDLLTKRNALRKFSCHKWIVLATACDQCTVEIMQQTGMSKPTICCRQKRYLDKSLPGLKRDKTRPSRVPGEIQLKVINETA